MPVQYAQAGIVLCSGAGRAGSKWWRNFTRNRRDRTNRRAAPARHPQLVKPTNAWEQYRTSTLPCADISRAQGPSVVYLTQPASAQPNDLRRRAAPGARLATRS